MKIDIHTHLLPPELPRFAERYGYGGFITLERHAPCRARLVRDDGKFFRETETETRLGNTTSKTSKSEDEQSLERKNLDWDARISIARNGQKFNPREMLDSIEKLIEKLRKIRSILQAAVDFSNAFRKVPKLGWYFDFSFSFLEGYLLLTTGMQELELVGTSRLSDNTPDFRC